MAHPSLFPLAPSAPRVRIAFLVTVGLMLALLFSGAGPAEADSVTTRADDGRSVSEIATAIDGDWERTDVLRTAP